jgi:hypothetical protein
MRALPMQGHRVPRILTHLRRYILSDGVHTQAMNVGSMRACLSAVGRDESIGERRALSQPCTVEASYDQPPRILAGPQPQRGLSWPNSSQYSADGSCRPSNHEVDEYRPSAKATMRSVLWATTRLCAQLRCQPWPLRAATTARSDRRVP